MKDIDFDELDKAVSSLMGTVPQLKEEVKTAAASPAPPTPQAPVVDVPAPPVASPVAVNVATPSRPAVAPAQRRGGRFMDMVHTSSDMKPRTTVPVSREGVNVAPRSESPSPQIAPITPAKDGIKDVEPPTEASRTQTTAWPDPLELSEKSDALKPEPTATVETVAAPDLSDVPEPPFESPFLSDAKVEKRPLNPGTPSMTGTPLETPAEEAAPQTEVATPTDETPRPFVPAELESDLVAIESNEPSANAPVGATDAPDEKPQAATPQNVAVSASIAQQYREQPSSGDQSHAAIYDTSQFASPLKHPAKKKAGWLWIVWVILLLALGAGGAVALYMADLI